jgi:hypothetical protein
VFAGETPGTFQLDDQHILHENIGKVLSHPVALVTYRVLDTSKTSSEYPLGQGVEVSVFICVHQRPIK